MSVNDICLASNRSLQDDWFGEEGNAKGLGEVRVARAAKKQNKWVVDILEEQQNLDPVALPSRLLFNEYLSELRENEQDCVLYVHGFNTSFEESLDDAWDIHKTYKIGVVLFSWPSNPGGLVKREYKRARRAAEASSPAFDSTLDKLGSYLELDLGERSEFDEDELCAISLNAMCFSQGNYLLQRYIESTYFDGETRLFTNVVLMQADVDSAGHEEWTAERGAFRRLYVTINENDRVLNKSEYLNPTRLGHTTQGLVARAVRYVDFTDTPNVKRKHGFFKSKKNGAQSNVRKFFTHALQGRLPERELALARDPQTTAFVVP